MNNGGKPWCILWLGASCVGPMGGSSLASHLPDEILAHRAAAGRREDYEEILTRYRDRVYRICYRMAGNAEDAEDWAQECFVRAYTQLGRYNALLPFAPWLLRVVSNTCINLAKSRLRVRSRLHIGEIGDFESPARGTNPMEIVADQGTRSVVAEAVGELPPLLRQAVVLRVQEDLSFKEIAEVLGVPLQTAASRVRRALMQVRERLAQQGYGASQ